MQSKIEVVHELIDSEECKSGSFGELKLKASNGGQCRGKQVSFNSGQINDSSPESDRFEVEFLPANGIILWNRLGLTWRHPKCILLVGMRLLVENLLLNCFEMGKPLQYKYANETGGCC